MTLKEIAAWVGAPVSTVSRIINSPSDSFACREVCDHVWAIIKETGYMPNQNAHVLKLGKDPSQEPSAGTLACILSRVKTVEDDPFFARLARVIEQRALEQSYPVRHSYSIFDVKISVIPEKTESLKADGAIILECFDGNYIGLLERQYKNLIYMGRNVTSTDHDQIICGGYEATQIAMNCLIACSHRRIGYIGGISNEVRCQTYLDALRENELKYSRSLIGDCLQNGIGGYRRAGHLLETTSLLPTAAFCATDIAAIAALRRFTEVRIKVPRQLSLIDTDNIEFFGYVSPILTTARMPIAEVGNMVVQTPIDRIQKRRKLLMKIFLPSKLAIWENVVNLNEEMYI